MLLDEWQAVPGVLGAVKRAVDTEPRPGRFLLTGSVRAALENEAWPGTGRLVRLAMHPMTVREQLGGYLELALHSGFPDPALRLSGRPRQAWLESYVEDLLTPGSTSSRPPPTSGCSKPCWLPKRSRPGVPTASNGWCTSRSAT